MHIPILVKGLAADKLAANYSNNVIRAECHIFVTFRQRFMLPRKEKDYGKVLRLLQ